MREKLGFIAILVAMFSMCCIDSDTYVFHFISAAAFGAAFLLLPKDCDLE